VLKLQRGTVFSTKKKLVIFAGEICFFNLNSKMPWPADCLKNTNKEKYKA
jgi:hypothetical protein